MPRLFEFQGHRGDSSAELSVTDSVKDELLSRYQQIQNRLSERRLQNEEVSVCESVIKPPIKKNLIFIKKRSKISSLISLLVLTATYRVLNSYSNLCLVYFFSDMEIS